MKKGLVSLFLIFCMMTTTFAFAQEMPSVFSRGAAESGSVYSIIFYTPLSRLAESMGKALYINAEDNKTYIDDRDIIKGVTLNTSSYTVTAELSNEEKIVTEIEEKSMDLENFNPKINEYEIELDYFEPVPKIEVDVKEPYTVKVDEWNCDKLEYDIEIFNSTGVKIASYTIRFKRGSFGEYVRSSSKSDAVSLSEIESVSALWKDSNTNVKCYQAEDNSWSVLAYSGWYELEYYPSPIVSDTDNLLSIRWSHENYNVYSEENGVTTKLFQAVKGDYGPHYEYAEFDAEKINHTLFIDYFEELPVITVLNCSQYEVRIEQAATDNPVAVVKIYSVSNDKLSLADTHTITFKRRSFRDTLESKGISVESAKNANEIYSKVVGREDKSVCCIKDESGAWEATAIDMYGKEYPIEAPDI